MSARGEFVARVRNTADRSVVLPSRILRVCLALHGESGCYLNGFAFYVCIFYFPGYYVFLGAMVSLHGSSRNVTTGFYCV